MSDRPPFQQLQDVLLDHGYVFEVPAAAEDEVEAVPYPAMGRFVHETVAVDKKTGVIYETEDYNPSGFFRFIFSM